MALPTPPSLGTAVRAAAIDFFHHSIRLVPANVAWGLPWAFALWLAVGGAFGPALVLLALLGIPAAGVFRLAALAVRGQDVNLSDAFAAWRTHFVPALAAGTALTAAATVLAVNVGLGVATGGPLGWGFATMAGWGLVACATYGLVLWPLLVDPARDGEPALRRARLAALLVVAFPLRLGGLAILAGLGAAVSTVAFVAVVTISIAFIALVACRIVLPAADRLEARLGGPAATSGPLPKGT